MGWDPGCGAERCNTLNLELLACDLPHLRGEGAARGQRRPLGGRQEDVHGRPLQLRVILVAEGRSSHAEGHAKHLGRLERQVERHAGGAVGNAAAQQARFRVLSIRVWESGMGRCEGFGGRWDLEV
jgi:hypothetical protein